MKHTRILAISVVAATALAISGCSGGGTDTSPPFDLSQLVETTPAGTKEVEHVTWGMHTGEPSTIEPSKIGDNSAYYAVANMCETLLLTTPGFGIDTNLATSAEWTDPTTLVLDLRDDVTFWNGAPLTPADVIFSLERAADEASGSLFASSFTRVASMTETGPHQVTITLTEPYGEFRNALAGPAGYVVEKAFVEAAGEATGTASGGIMCTGPYQFQSWTAGESITMTSYADHWKKAPLVKELELVFLDSDTTLTSALLSGEIDGAFDVPSASRAQFEGSSQGTLYVGPSTVFSAFIPADPNSVGSDPLVREALDVAIDKQAAIDAALNGLAAPVKTFVPPFVWESSDQAEIYRAGYDALPDNSGGDIDRGRELVEEAGATGAELVLATTAGDQSALALATIVQATGEQIGLKIEVRQLQPAEFGAILYDPAGREGLDFVLTTGYSDTPAVLVYPSYFVLPGGLFNWTEYDDPAVTAAMDAAATSADPAEAAEAFVEAQSLYGDDRILIMFGNEYARTFLSNDLTGVVTSSARITSPWAIDLGGK